MSEKWEAGYPAVETNWRKPLWKGFAVIGATVALFWVWSFVARLDGAAMGDGVITVESNRKTVQHLEGGIVREIRVRDGATVNQGDVLVTLDPTRAEATSGLYHSQLAIALANEARLVAERDSASSFEFPEEVLRLQKDLFVKRAMADQQRQFEARRQSLLNQISILNVQIEQIRNESAGISTERRTAEDQLSFVSREVSTLRGLYEKRLVDLPRVSTKEVEQLRLQGVIAHAAIDIAKAEQRISEAQLKIEQLKQERTEDASKLLPDLRKQISDLRQQIVLATDTLDRIEVRAPTTGVVQQLRIFTVGGVLRSGDPILDIVPSSDQLIIRAKMSTMDVHRLHPGMLAEIRFPAFKRASLSYFTGNVKTISTDRLYDELNRSYYFAADVTVDRTTIPREIDEKLSAGLSADVIVPTGERTAIEYLISPLTERLSRSFREQ